MGWASETDNHIRHHENIILPKGEIPLPLNRKWSPAYLRVLDSWEEKTETTAKIQFRDLDKKTHLLREKRKGEV